MNKENCALNLVDEIIPYTIFSSEDVNTIVNKGETKCKHYV